MRWLCHMWVFFFCFFFYRISIHHVIYFLQKIQQSIIRPKRLLSFLQLLGRCKIWPHAQHKKEQHNTVEEQESIWMWLQCSCCFGMICIHTIKSYPFIHCCWLLTHEDLRLSVVCVKAAEDEEQTQQSNHGDGALS